MNSWLRLALPKGKLFWEAKKLMLKAGYSEIESVSDDDRQMIFTLPEAGIKIMIIRPTDVPVYVDHGAADIGIAGKDILLEKKCDVFELMDLGFGGCHMALAVPEKDAKDFVLTPNIRVATKFPNISKTFLSGEKVHAEIIELHGAVEIAPLVGLSEAVIDIVSSGKTLKENGMVEVRNIVDITARLIANRVSYRMKLDEIREFESRMQNIL